MIAGILIGYILRKMHPDQDWLKQFSDNISVITDIFLRLIKMIIAPLVITTLIVGVAKLGDIKAVGRVGGKTMLWFIAASLVSLFIGLILVNVLRPGDIMHLQVPDIHSTGIAEKSNVTFRGFITHVFPQSIFESMANNEILQIVVFALFFGVATAAIGQKGAIIVQFLDAAANVMLVITGYVMKLAPVAVLAAMASVVAREGLDILLSYGVFILEFYAGLIILWGVIALAGFLVVRKRSFRLFGKIKDPVLLAFSTSSSEAAFPSLMEELEKFGCPDKIVSFVLPLGYSFNLDGSMMYMTFASLFIAQIYGIHLDLWQQITMLLVLMLSSKGIAGVPRASLVVIAGTLSMFHVPEAGLILLLGVDHLLDMGRSATNIVGNGMATVVVSHWENELGPEHEILPEEEEKATAVV
jgi:Na+/H+-dicarboxylate symporter